MLLLCIGPDTFRAVRRARELEQAFRQKYDAAGSSVERLASGKQGVDEVIERVNTASLFSPKRFLRTSNLIRECPAVKMPALKKALETDAERVIVVSVEEDLPDRALKALDGVKIVQYPYSILHGRAFLLLVRDLAQELEIDEQSSLQQIAESVDGDGWAAYQELIKLSAGNHQFPATAQQIEGQSLSSVLFQARNAIRNSSGNAALAGKTARALLALMAQRNGLGLESEIFSLL